QSPHHRPTPRPCSAEPPSRTIRAEGRRRGTGRGVSWKRSSGPARRHQDPIDKTSDTRGSGEPLRTTVVPSGCRSNSPQSAFGSAVPDRSRAVPSHCRRAPDALEPRSGRQSDRSLAADASRAHAVREQTRRITRPVGLAVPPSSTAPSRRDLAKSANYITILQTFFNTIHPQRKLNCDAHFTEAEGGSFAPLTLGKSGASLVKGGAERCA